jgi:hypothetical protein
MSFTDSIKNSLEKVTAATRDLVRGAQEVRADLDSVRELIAAKGREIQKILEAPPPPEERIATHARLVDAKASAWERAYWPGFLLRLDGALSNQDLAGHVSSARRQPELPSTLDLDPDGARCFFRGSEMKADFARVLRAHPYEAGPASGERPALLERLRAELVELEAAEEDAVDKLNAQGVMVAHRVAVVERRERAERAGQLEAERLKNRRHTEEALKRTPTYHTANFKPGSPR